MSYWQLSPVFWRENCAPRFPRSHRLNFLPRQLFCFQNITKSVLLGIDKRYVLLFLYRNRNCALSFGIIAIVFPQLCELAMSIHIRPLYFNQTNFAHGQHPCGRILRWVDLWVDKKKPIICARNMSARSREHSTERSENMWKLVYSQNNRIVWLSNVAEIHEVRKGLWAFFSIVLSGCWLAGQANPITWILLS